MSLPKHPDEIIRELAGTYLAASVGTPRWLVMASIAAAVLGILNDAPDARRSALRLFRNLVTTLEALGDLEGPAAAQVFAQHAHLFVPAEGDIPAGTGEMH